MIKNELHDKIISLIEKHRSNEGRSPSLYELAKELDMTPQGVAYHIERMIDAELLTRITVGGYTVPRSLRVVEQRNGS